MRTHIFLILVAFMVSACASREHLSQSEQERQQARQEEFSQNQFDAGSRIR